MNATTINKSLSFQEQYAWKECYKDVEGLIHDLVWKHKTAHGGDLEELRAIASLAFVQAYRTWSPSKGTVFSTWVRWIVYYALLDEWTARAAYESRKLSSLSEGTAERQEMQHSTLKDIQDSTPFPFDKDDFLLGLTQDAQLTAALVLGNTFDVELARRKKRLKDTPAGIRLAVKDVLESIGWTASRIAESFAEIAQLLIR